MPESSLPEHIDGTIDSQSGENQKVAFRNFAVRDVSVSLSPAIVPLKSYSITVLDGQVLVDFDYGSQDNKKE